MTDKKVDLFRPPDPDEQTDLPFTDREHDEMRRGRVASQERAKGRRLTLELPRQILDGSGFMINRVREATERNTEEGRRLFHLAGRA
jgi:hypothetical protein